MDFVREELGIELMQISGLDKSRLIEMLDLAKGVEIYWRTDDEQDVRFYNLELPPCSFDCMYTVRNSDGCYWENIKKTMKLNIAKRTTRISNNILTVYK